MRLVLCFSFVFLLVGCGDDPQAPEAIEPLTILIEGALGDSLFGNLPADSFPFPKLKSGTFSGWFSYFLEATPVDSFGSYLEYPFLDLSINIIDSTGVTIYMITSAPNRLRISADSTDKVGLLFGPSVGFPEVPGDLRIILGGVFAGGPPSLQELQAATLSRSILETDGQDAFTFWDLLVETVVFSTTTSSH